MPVDENPFASASMTDLPRHWRTSFLRVLVERPPGFDCGPSLPARLRGALGHALLARRSEPECEAARDILFETRSFRPRTELPKPFVISASEAGASIAIDLTLFGIADRWRTPIFEALLKALAAGITIGEAVGCRRCALAVVSAEWSRRESIEVPASGLSARLRFTTPLRLGSRHGLGMRWGDVVVSLAERAAGLARWNGLDVDPQLGEWRAVANGLHFSEALRPVRWDRRSGAQRGREIAMMGYLGTLDILRPPQELMPLLALGETMHVGGGASLGLGRYDLL